MLVISQSQQSYRKAQRPKVNFSPRYAGGKR